MRIATTKIATCQITLGCPWVEMTQMEHAKNGAIIVHVCIAGMPDDSLPVQIPKPKP